MTKSSENKMLSKSARLKEWWEVEKSRIIDNRASLATSPDESIAHDSSKILRYRNDHDRAKANCTWIVLVGLVDCLYLYSLITDFDWWWLALTGIVTAFLCLQVWITNAAMKSAKDPCYDWAEEYDAEALAWRQQRADERKHHQPMKEYKKQ